MEVIMYLSQLNQNPNHAPALVIEAPKKSAASLVQSPVGASRVLHMMVESVWEGGWLQRGYSVVAAWLQYGFNMVSTWFQHG